jgi:membrane protease YdiL (CAAX protease family)
MITAFIGELISSVAQVLIFSLIPFLVWLLTARKKQSFFSWLGFKKVTSDKKECAKFIICSVIICDVVGLIVYKILLDADWNKSSFAAMGISGLPSSILNAVVHTALSEEILFRGFIQKRLQTKFSFKVSTAIQAVLFGFAHIVLILDKINFVEGVALVLFPILPGILFAYANEKKGDGSIFPGWIMHGSMNIIKEVFQMLV